MGIDIGAGLETVALPSLPGKVPVHYSPGYQQRAANLRDLAAKAVDFFEQRLGVTPKVYLAVLLVSTGRTSSAAPGTACPTPPPRRVPASYACRPRTTRSTSWNGASRRICRTRR